MRRLVVLVSLVSIGAVVAGCSVETIQPPPPDPVPESCFAKVVTPAFGASGVGTRPDISVTFNQAIDATDIENKIAVSRLGGEPVPFTVEPAADRVVIHVTNELRYWEDYDVTVTGVASADDPERTCETVDLAFATLEPSEAPQPIRATQVSASAMIDATHLGVVSPSGRSLQVYDVADPAHPLIVSETAVEEGPQGIVVDGTRAYLAAGARGIPEFDVSDPKAPKRIGLAGTPGDARRAIPLTQNGKSYLIVADAAGGVRILDATTADGAKDVWIGNVVEGAQAIALEGNLLAVVDLGGSVELFDLSSFLAGQASAPALLSKTAPSPSDDFRQRDRVQRRRDPRQRAPRLAVVRRLRVVRHLGSRGAGLPAAPARAARKVRLWLP